VLGSLARGLRRALAPLLATVLVTALAAPAVVATASPSGALIYDDDVDPTPQVRRITFPVVGRTSYWDDFGACRSDCSRGHEGNDIMGERLQHLVAANAGRITWARLDASGTSGNMLILQDDAGWQYWYIHLNNDTPGTDDGANPRKWILAPGVRVGSRVDAGQHIAYMGDSGNAETTAPHLHFEIHRPDAKVINPYHSLRLAQGLTAPPWCAYPSNPPHRPRAAAGRGYWMLQPDGTVLTFGNARNAGQPRAGQYSGRLVDLAPTPTGRGYWITTTTGQVMAFGDAGHLGDLRSTPLNAAIVGMDATPTGAGYWLFAADGGVFSFGDARFHGSTGNLRLNAPVVGMASTRTGEGYWLFAQDGGVFSFGDARFHGSTGNLRLNAPIIGMVRSPRGEGYLLLGSDGGAFTFGDAVFYGSLPGYGLCDMPAATALVPTVTGRGYWILGRDGRLFGFGDAPLHGDASGAAGRPVAMAVVPA
jgi:hypothetical protein